LVRIIIDDFVLAANKIKNPKPKSSTKMRSSASLLREAFVKDRACSPRHPKENPKKNLKLKTTKLEYIT